MVSENVLISGGVGAGVGLVLSVIFGIYSKKTADSTTKEIFGVSSQNFVNYITLSALSVLVVFLSTMCILVRDGKYPSENPIRFTIETLAMGIVPALLFLGSLYSRVGGLGTHPVVKFLIIVVKCGLGHVLLQYSGYYSAILA
jgi:hypothetical protein